MTWLADLLDCGVVIVMVDYNHNKTGVASNFWSRFPDSNARQLVLDTLRTGMQIVKGDIAPVKLGEDP